VTLTCFVYHENLYKLIQNEAFIKFKKPQADTIKFKKHKQVITGVFYVINQNVKIFRGFVSHRHYFR